MQDTSERTADRDAVGALRPAAATGIAFWVAAIAVPVIALYGDGVRQPVDGLLLQLNLALLVYTATRLAMLIAGKRPTIATGVFWLFMYVTMAVVPLAQAQTGLYGNLVLHRFLVPAQTLALLTAVSFDVGQYLARRRPPTGPARVAPIERRVIMSRLHMVTAAAIVISVVFIVQLGGPETFFASRAARGAALTDAGFSNQGSQVGRALYSALAVVPVLVAFMAWTVLLVRRRRHGQPIMLGQLLVWLVLLALNAVVNSPAANTRYWFLTVVFGLLFLAPGLKMRLFRGSLIGGIVGAVVVFPYTDYFRYTPEYRATLQLQSIAEKISSKDFDQSIMTANGMWYVADHGFTFGGQLLGVVLFWLPRSIWPDKPADTGLLIGESLTRAGTPNLSSPMFLEFWFDFSWFGAAILMAVVGWMVRRLDDRFVAGLDARRSHVLGIDLLLPLIAGYLFILLRGPLLQAMGLLAVVLVTCWFIAPPTKVATEPSTARAP